MELPITIIITLFVALAVGFAVLTFSEQTLFQGRENLGNLNNKEMESDVISVANAGPAVMRDLAVQCAKDHSNIDKAICFTVRGNIEDLTSIHGDAININSRNFTIQVSASPNPVAAFIYYNPLGTIDIES